MKFFKVRILRSTSCNCQPATAGTVVDASAHDVLSLIAAGAGELVHPGERQTVLQAARTESSRREALPPPWQRVN